MAENQALREHQFKTGTSIPRHTQKHPDGYLTAKLKRCLRKIINVPDPEHPENLIKLRVADALVWRRLFNATEGDDQAIERVFDRIDGKVAQKTEHSGQIDSGTKIIIVYPSDYKPKEKVGVEAEEVSSRVL